jgi:glycoprotease/Kae1 family metallohydrolase
VTAYGINKILIVFNLKNSLMQDLISLGIESSAYAFGVGIVTGNGKILANERAIYKPKLGGGLIPDAAQKFHQENSKTVLENALKKAKLKIEDVDVISYTAGAGIPLCLIVGVNLATEISKKISKPLIPVCHQIGHLEIGRLTTNVNDPVFVYLSGGNSQILTFIENYYRVMGETMDIPLGNALDVLAREMGLPTPGGQSLEELAKKGKNFIELPYVVKGNDLSYSGILTAAMKKLKEGVSKEDLAFSMQETCFAMLCEATERVLAHTDKKEVLLVGGVAANKRLQEMIKVMTDERGAEFFVVPQEYSGDGGSMIAWTGLLCYIHKKIPKIQEKVLPRWRIDNVPWFQHKFM